MGIRDVLISIMGSRPLIALAPLAGFTDHPFRQVALRLGADYAVTEMISAEALVRKVSKTLNMLRGLSHEPMTFVQLMGARPWVMADAAKIAVELGARGIDINMGCPERRIVAQGAGAALLKSHDKALSIVRAVVDSVPVPVTVKMRIGWGEGESRDMNQLLKEMADAGISMVAIHARTRQQMFSGEPNWDAVSEITQGIALPVIVNGNILCYETARKALEITGARGLMIGRGALGCPWVFKAVKEPGCLEGRSKLELIHCFKEAIWEHLSGIIKFYGETQGLFPLRQHLAWYSKGLHDSARFRRWMSRCGSSTALVTGFWEFLGLN